MSQLGFLLSIDTDVRNMPHDIDELPEHYLVWMPVAFITEDNMKGALAIGGQG